MARVPCPSCGRLVERGSMIKGLCPDCFRDRYGIARLPRSVEVLVCKYCGAYKYQGAWNQGGATVDDTVEDYLYFYLTRKVKPVEGLEEAWIDSIEPLNPIVSPGLYRFKVRVSGRKHSTVINDELVIDVNVKAGVCPSCAKKITGSGHEAEVKIRSSEGRMSEHLKSSVEAFLRRVAPAIREAIVKVDYVREGIDIYLSDASAARMLAGKLRSEFSGSVIESYKLVSRKPSGRRVGRLTISVRLPDVEPGTIFTSGGRRYLLLSRTRRGLLVVDVERGVETLLTGQQLESGGVERYEGGPELRRFMLLSREGGNIVFLDVDKNYQDVVELPESRVRILVDTFRAGETYEVFMAGNRIYVLRRISEGGER